ncbi:helix-turn-helix domain-containing protein [Niabella hirudinis]|uniref:helix-turn-helix domain-containing protein n=1 Tax=Niabella hirudinis TaxID=1285929 RepID=UPI003EBCE99E
MGRYERYEASPSIEVAAKIADTLDVSLDYLAGNTDLLLEKNVVNKIIRHPKTRSRRQSPCVRYT